MGVSASAKPRGLEPVAREGRRLDAHLRELGRGTAGHLRHAKLAELLLELLKLALELRLAPVAQLVHLDLGCKRQRGARGA